jgi:hypothetical protein
MVNLPWRVQMSNDWARFTVSHGLSSHVLPTPFPRGRGLIRQRPAERRARRASRTPVPPWAQGARPGAPPSESCARGGADGLPPVPEHRGQQLRRLAFGQPRPDREAQLAQQRGLFLRWLWPSAPATCLLPPVPTPPVPKRKRERLPFAGFTQKLHCDACEHHGALRPQPPSSRPPHIVMTRGCRRQVDTSMHFCPNSACCAPHLLYLSAAQGISRLHLQGCMSYTALDISP